MNLKINLKINQLNTCCKFRNQIEITILKNLEIYKKAKKKKPRQKNGV